ncbi:hypothetical protein QYE76_018148, partial [Lolium multiflorum]
MEHWTAVKNILKYLKRTKDMFLCYGGDQELVVNGYTDASWNTDPDDSKSQSGYVFILNGAAVSWASCTVAKSSTESEYIAASEASSEAVPLRYRLGSSKVWTLLRYRKRTSTELWRIIEEGYSPRDPMNLTRREVVDHQLNVIAIDMIHLAIAPKDHTLIRSLKTAKEAWNELDKLYFLGNGSIQCSHFSEAMANDFVMIEG